MYKTLFEYICLIHKDISFERNRLSTELNEYVERDEQEMNGSDNPEYKEFGEWLRKQRGSHSLRWLANRSMNAFPIIKMLPFAKLIP